MNDLHLPSDVKDSFQSHLEELFRRISTIVVLVVILTGIWSLSIDQILNHLLTKLDPCDGSCVNIFSPEEWAGTRWLSAGLLAIFTAGPFIIMQIYSFGKNGLLPSERTALVSWMFVIWILSILTLYYTSTTLLPNLYEYGHSFNEDTGLVGRYDAAEMLKISIAITWTLILILAASSVVIIAGKMGLLWEGNSEWWRIRVHGMMLMLIWLILPNSLPGLFVTLTVSATGFVELIGYKQFRKPMPIGYGLRDLLDSDGKEHRILYANCSCCGTSPNVEPLSGMGIMSFDSVCRSVNEQNSIIDSVNRFNVNKVVFSGCVIESFPPAFLDNLRFLGCDYQTLSLAYLSNLHTNDSNVDGEIAMALLTDPWSENQMIERCLNVLSKYKITNVKYSDKLIFGLNLQPTEVWIQSPTLNLLDSIKKNGISLTDISN